MDGWMQACEMRKHLEVRVDIPKNHQPVFFCMLFSGVWLNIDDVECLPGSCVQSSSLQCHHPTMSRGFHKQCAGCTQDVRNTSSYGMPTCGFRWIQPLTSLHDLQLTPHFYRIFPLLGTMKINVNPGLMTPYIRCLTGVIGGVPFKYQMITLWRIPPY